MSQPLSQAAAGEGLQPSLAELVALAADVRLRAHHRPLRSSLAGQQLSRLAGRGMDHADSRPYVAGDEARHVDWRVTARTGQLYSKRFHAERERLCLLLMDVQPGQFFGTRVRLKSVQAARGLAAAAWWAQLQGDRLALLDNAGSPPLLAGRGQAGVMRVLQALVQGYAQAPAAPLPHGLTGLLEQAARLCRGGTVVLATDAQRAAVVPRQVWQACCRHLQLHLLVLVDALEIDPPARPLLLAGVDGVQRLDFARAAVRAQWRAHTVDPLQALQALQVPGMQVHCLMTDDAADSWLPQAGGGG
ncbi:MAG: DUF58 domain-containing protein [Stenotrophomonas sp.]